MLRTPEIESINHFLLELYPNACNLAPEDFQRTTLANLRPIIPFDYAAWGGAVGANRRVTDVVMLDQSERLFPEWSQSVAESDTYCDQLLGQLGLSLTFDDVPDYRKSVAYNEHWRRYDTAHMLTTSVAEPIAGYGSFLSLCRSDQGGNFRECERQIKQILMPHIVNALHLNRRTVTEFQAGPNEGIAIINPVVGVLSSGPVFDALTGTEWGSKEAAQELTALLPPRGKRLEWRGETLQIRCSPLGDNFLLRVTARLPVDKLSQREQQVAALFAEGLSYHEVARELHMAPSTARTHIARIYERLGVKSKARLIHALSA